MRVKVKAFANLGEIVGEKSIAEVEEGSSVMSLLEGLCSFHPDLQKALFDSKGKIKEEVTLLWNRKGLDPSGLAEIILKEGDEVALLPAFSGG